MKQISAISEIQKTKHSLHRTTKSFRRMLGISLFLSFALLTMSKNLHAQNSMNVKAFRSKLAQLPLIESSYKIINYGEKHQFGEIHEASTWTVSFLEDNKTYTLSGNQINDFVFEKPGIYEISFNDNQVHQEGTCNHSPFPPKMVIKVSAVNMQFNTEKIKFSNAIQKGIPTDGITMRVPVSIKSYDNKPVPYTQTIVKTAGIGSEIIAELKSDKLLTEGTHILLYNLKGIANNEAYIMFDFTDINGQVQSYSYQNLIK